MIVHFWTIASEPHLEVDDLDRILFGGAEPHTLRRVSKGVSVESFVLFSLLISQAVPALPDPLRLFKMIVANLLVVLQIGTPTAFQEFNSLLGFLC